MRWYVMGGLHMFLGGNTCLGGGSLSHALVVAAGRKRLGRAVFPLFGATTAAAAMFSVHFFHSPVPATALLCLASAAGDFGQAANWASIMDLGGKYAGTTAGFINMIGNIGNAAQPFIGAWIFTRFGWNVL